MRVPTTKHSDSIAIDKSSINGWTTVLRTTVTVRKRSLRHCARSKWRLADRFATTDAAVIDANREPELTRWYVSGIRLMAR